jgi:hypothetical protein
MKLANNQLTNSLINQLTIAQYASRTTQYASRNTLNAIPYTLSPIVKLINQLTSSPINFQNAPLHLSRELYKSTLFLQNKANSPIVQNDTTLFSIRTYKIFVLKTSPKNEAKQSQNKANFGLKLASFFRELASVSPKIAVKCLPKYIISLCTLCPLWLKYFCGLCGKKDSQKMNMLVFYIKKLTVLICVNMYLIFLSVFETLWQKYSILEIKEKGL